MDMRGTAKTENQTRMMQAAWEKRQKRRNLPANLSNIRYVPREIHVVMSTASHGTLAHMAAVKEQEKFRADPRFPLFQLTQRIKRYKEIFAGPPYKPIFA